MALVELDRLLLERLIAREPKAWQEFVDRFLGVVLHSIKQTTHLRSITLDFHEVEDLAAEILKLFVQDEHRLLRNFRGHSSLATYIVVISRRVSVHALAKKAAQLHRRKHRPLEDFLSVTQRPVGASVESIEEVGNLLKSLEGKDAALVRGLYLEHKSYRQLSEELEMPMNSIGPTARRILRRLRRASA